VVLFGCLWLYTVIFVFAVIFFLWSEISFCYKGISQGSFGFSCSSPSASTAVLIQKNGYQLAACDNLFFAAQGKIVASPYPKVPVRFDSST
jgi:hypothetical protein